MNENQKRVVIKLLTYDLVKFGARFELVPETEIVPLSEIEVVELLNIAEILSRKAITDEQRYTCLTICGLLWEHRHPEWIHLAQVLLIILARLGLGPSAQMLKEGIDLNTNQFYALQSYLSELTVTRELIANEVIVAGIKPILLSRAQKMMWDLITQHDRVGISAPTSAGKSYVLTHKIVDHLSNNPGEVVYIVPTLALVNQVSADIRKALKEYGIGDYSVKQSYSLDQERENQHIVYVLTQERALSAFSQDDVPFQKLQLLIIDEIQNIERISNENEERAHNLLDVIHEFTNNVNPTKVVISGPRISNIEDVTSVLFPEDLNTVKSLNVDMPPVVNITYSFAKSKSKIFLKQYTSLSKALSISPLSVLIKDTTLIKKILGSSRYTDPVHEFIKKLLGGFEKDESTLIFAPTASQAEKTAVALVEESQNSPSSQLLALQNYIATSVHPLYSMVDTIGYGVGFHHGAVPPHIRNVVEKSFAQKVLHTVVCTTTLMQGVNLPAKNLIARNPNLFINKKDNSAHLTSYEFANLRGRAGRLLKDFVGRAIILDETAFEKSEYLQEYATKEIDADYGEKYAKNKKEINRILESSVPATDQLAGSDIVVYVRQMIVRYGDQALRRIRKVGINISAEHFSKIKNQLDILEVPRRICAGNPYWDPIVLNDIFLGLKSRNDLNIPRTPYDKKFVGSLKKILEFAHSASPYYYSKYLNIDHPKRLLSVLLNAAAWSKESPLSEILTSRKITSASQVTDIISCINKETAHDLPKLLKPIFDMTDPENSVLSSIQSGSIYPETRRFMDLGIPREIAIKLRMMLKSDQINIYREENIDENLMRQALKTAIKDLGYWERVQLDGLSQ